MPQHLNVRNSNTGRGITRPGGDHECHGVDDGAVDDDVDADLRIESSSP